jgi:hypothetical protein
MLAHNESHRDRALRFIAGALLLALYLGAGKSWGTTFLAAGAYLVVTGVIGFCPLRWALKAMISRHPADGGRIRPASSAPRP